MVFEIDGWMYGLRGREERREGRETHSVALA